MLRTFQHWIATIWLEIDQDNLRMKFSAFNVDFSSPSSDLLGSRRLAQAGVKDSYPPKKWLFYRYWLLSRVVWTWLQIGTDMLLIITSTGDKLLRGINISDLEWPWTSKIRGFSDFFTFLSCNTHFKSKLHQKGWRQNQDNLQMKFSALNVDFGSSKYQLHKFKEVCAHGHQRGISS